LAVLDGLMARLAGKQGHWTLQQVAKSTKNGIKMADLVACDSYTPW